MAFLRELNVAEAFGKNPQLQQFILTGVIPTGNVMGTGVFGSVEEVSPYILHFRIVYVAIATVATM